MNTDKKIKLIGAIFGIIMFIALIAGVTYAWVSWQSDNTRLSGNTGCFPNINYTNGSSLSSNNVLLFDEDIIFNNNKILMKDGMTYLNFTANIGDDCKTPVQLRINFNVSELNDAFISGNSIGAFKFVLAKYDSNINDLSQLNGKNLDIVESGVIETEGDYSFLSGRLTTAASGYLLIFYIDGDIAFNDAAYSNFGVSINVIAQSMDK